MARTRSSKTSNNSANIGFEAKLWLAADKLCGNFDAVKYVHVVIGRTATPSTETNGLFSSETSSGIGAAETFFCQRLQSERGGTEA